MEDRLEHLERGHLAGERRTVLVAELVLAEREQRQPCDLRQRTEDAELRERADPAAAVRRPHEVGRQEQDPGHVAYR